jgi:hypothetical protein
LTLFGFYMLLFALNPIEDDLKLREEEFEDYAE